MVTKIVIQIKIMIVVLTIITIGATKIIALIITIGVITGQTTVTAGAIDATAGATDATKIIGASVEPYVFHA